MYFKRNKQMAKLKLKAFATPHTLFSFFPTSIHFKLKSNWISVHYLNGLNQRSANIKQPVECLPIDGLNETAKVNAKTRLIRKEAFSKMTPPLTNISFALTNLRCIKNGVCWRLRLLFDSSRSGHIWQPVWIILMAYGKKLQSSQLG